MAIPREPDIKRVVVFIDGQNLYYAAKDAFGYTAPNYDVVKLAASVCTRKGWTLGQVRFYTGVPGLPDKPDWHRFWQNRFSVMGRQGVWVYSRPLKYRNKTIRLPDGSKFTYLTGSEKGIDVRLALDVVSLGHAAKYDVALLFSQDQDLSEVADEIRVISRQQGRWLRIASAFPDSPTSRNHRGINKTDWIPIDRTEYDACIDPRDYRPKPRV